MECLEVFNLKTKERSVLLAIILLTLRISSRLKVKAVTGKMSVCPSLNLTWISLTIGWNVGTICAVTDHWRWKILSSKSFISVNPLSSSIGGPHRETNQERKMLSTHTYREMLIVHPRKLYIDSQSQSNPSPYLLWLQCTFYLKMQLTPVEKRQMNVAQDF